MCLAIPGEILYVFGDGLEKMAKVRFAGISKNISLAYLPEANQGDYIVVHAGVAISLLDPIEAKETLKDLQTIGQIDEIC